MTEVVESIPTLTDIVKAGNPAMLNHFDAHQFDTTTEDQANNIIKNSLEDDLQSIIEVSDIIESASASEESDFDIPSIQLDSEGKTEIPDKFYSKDENLNSDIVFNEASGTKEAREKIDKVVQNLLPEIEKKLKESLYQEFEV